MGQPRERCGVWWAEEEQRITQKHSQSTTRMMEKNNDLWKALAEAREALERCVADCQRRPSPARHVAIGIASDEYHARLAAVIGSQLAGQWQASYQATIDAIDRLQAALAVEVAVDESDVAFLNQLREAVRMRQAEFAAAEAAVTIGLDEARR
jgi:hypothetical protein